MQPETMGPQEPVKVCTPKSVHVSIGMTVHSEEASSVPADNAQSVFPLMTEDLRTNT